MSITIIPLLTRRFQEDEADAWNFFSCVFCWMTAASTLLTIGGMAVAPWLAQLVAPGFTPEQWLRLAFFMRIILPAQIFFLCGACVTALLFMRRQFRVPALAPLIYNGAIIAVGLLLPWLATTQTAQNALPTWLLAHMDGMTGYCVGVTLGAALGTFVLPLRVAAQQGLRLRMVWRHPLMGRFLLTALPLMLGQTIMMLDEQFLRVFGSLAGDGAVSLLNYARRITQVPVGLVGQAAAVASYPFLVALLAQGDTERFNATLRTALRASVALIIPCAFCMAATSWPILGVIFQGGRFGPAETLAATPLTQIMLAATPFWIIYMVLVRAYYAHGDTITPAVTGTIMTVVCLPIYYYWAVPHGAWAIAALSGLSVSLYVLWLMALWARRQGQGAFAGLCGLALRAIGCSLPGTAAAWWLSAYTLSRAADLGLHALWAALLALALGGCAFLLLFLPLCLWLAPSIMEPVLRKLRRT